MDTQTLKTGHPYDLFAIVGPTASGKTQLAANLAHRLRGEIISADSRQVYRNMDIGTGKDLADYEIDGQKVPYHLIDIADAGSRYNVYQYQNDFLKVYNSLINRHVQPILCGGSGLYIEAVLRGYRLLQVPNNPELRAQLDNKTDTQLAQILAQYKQLHNTTDLDTRKRTIRAIEIEEYYSRTPQDGHEFPKLNSIIFGVRYDRQTEMQRIRQRLEQRLANGMLDEVRALLNAGIPPENLTYYGLEYKFVTEHLTGMLTYNIMVERLNIAIRQFAKRQMTWFRGMQRRGLNIHWIAGEQSLEQKLQLIEHQLNTTTGR